MHHALAGSSVSSSTRRSSASWSGDTTMSATGSSIVCSRKRSSFGHGSTGTNSPSTRRCVLPRAFAHFARSGHALAVDDERREQPDVLAAMIAQQLRGDRFDGLRRDGRAVVDAMLQAELHVQQPQECQTSDVVATVLLRPPRDGRCSIATVGGMPYTASTSGRPAGCTIERAYAFSDSR